MTVTDAKELFEELEKNGYGECNISVNNIRPNVYNLHIGKWSMQEIYDRLGQYTWEEIQEMFGHSLK